MSTPREQAEQVVAEAIDAYTERVHEYVLNTADRDFMATVIVKQLLAARVPCPTCGGTGTVLVQMSPPFENRAAKDEVPCPGCRGDGRSTPLVLLAPLHVGVAFHHEAADEIESIYTLAEADAEGGVKAEWQSYSVPVYVARPESESLPSTEAPGSKGWPTPTMRSDRSPTHDRSSHPENEET